jgi:hypothetical protein
MTRLTSLDLDAGGSKLTTSSIEIINNMTQLNNIELQSSNDSSDFDCLYKIDNLNKFDGLQKITILKY